MDPNSIVGWLQQNQSSFVALGAAIMSLLGSLYAVARIIVFLTPTPVDDARLEEVAGWIRGLASVFGLSLKQGVTKK